MCRSARRRGAAPARQAQPWSQARRFPRRGERGQTYGRWRSFWYTVYQRSLEGKLLRGEPQPPDQRALELEVGGGVRVEIRASEISDGLPGIGDRLAHGVVGQSLAAGGLEP